MTTETQNSTDSSFSAILAGIHQFRDVLVPIMAGIEQGALEMKSLPPEAQREFIRGARTVIRPLLEAFRGLVEPIARADQKLAALEEFAAIDQLERSRQ